MRPRKVVDFLSLFQHTRPEAAYFPSHLGLTLPRHGVIRNRGHFPAAAEGVPDSRFLLLPRNVSWVWSLEVSKETARQHEAEHSSIVSSFFCRFPTYEGGKNRCKKWLTIWRALTALHLHIVLL